MTVRKSCGPTDLYRHFDADGALLYVGISLSALGRLQAHKSGSHWSSKIASVTIESFATREEALRAEKEAIRTERPRFNIAHARERSTSSNLPAIPREFNASYMDCGTVVLSTIWHDAENDPIVVDFLGGGELSLITPNLTYVQLTIDQLGALSDLSEAAEAWYSATLLASDDDCERAYGDLPKRRVPVLGRFVTRCREPSCKGLEPC